MLFSVDFCVMRLVLGAVALLLVVAPLGCSNARERQIAGEQAAIYHLRNVEQNAELEVKDVTLQEEIAKRQHKKFDHALVVAAVQRAARAEFDLRSEEDLHPEAIASLQ